MIEESKKPSRGFFENAQNWVVNYPGFFAPYKNSEDFLFTLASPIIAPPILAYTSFQCLALSMAVAALTIPVTTLTMIPSALFNKPEWVTNVFDFMLSAIKKCLLGSLAFAGLALVSIVGAPLGLVTRTISSIVDAIINLFQESSPIASAMTAN